MCNGNWELSERFTDKETSATTSRRSVLSKVRRSADKGVARFGAIFRFSGGSERYNPGFRQTEKIRFMKVYKIE